MNATATLAIVQAILSLTAQYGPEVYDMIRKLRAADPKKTPEQVLAEWLANATDVKRIEDEILARHGVVRNP